MPTFPIHELPYIRRYEDRARAARQAAGITDNTAAANTSTPIKTSHTAADAHTLRGIPAVGRSVSGAIRGTNPLLETIRRLTPSDR